MPPAVGFAGLGAMGRGMARNLLKAQLLAAVWNRTESRASGPSVCLRLRGLALPRAGEVRLQAQDRLRVQLRDA